MEIQTKEGNLRVWWIPQLGMDDPFIVPVKSLNDAVLILKTLAQYDAFQYENKIKPDYSNTGGLEIFEDGEWLEWYNEETGEGIELWMERGIK